METNKKDMKAWAWLNKNELSYNIWDKKYRYHNESFDEWLDRVSGCNTKIKDLIFQKKFIFGGRTLSNRGTSKSGSFSNCYSIGYVPDSLEGIMDVAHKIALTFKSQGGQGLSLSKIRPKGALIHGEFPSDGIVPFMEIFNTVTDSISQGGSRKGALLMSLDINHPEAETFMTIKSDANRITKANLSMEISDDFMKQITCDKPDSNKIRLFKILAEQACKHAEPGVIFTDRFRNYNMMQYVDGYNIETCNPCGEQPLPKHGACNLSSINISEYITNPFTEQASLDFASLLNDLPVILEAMDDVLEENLPNHALEEQRHMAKTYRNVGIGVMGIHDALIKSGYVYGSKEACEFVDVVMSFIFRGLVISSIALGSKRGNFPGYDPCVWDSDILKHAFSKAELAEFKKQNTLRNCSLVSIAPTGSIGTMLNVSTGIEPWFATHYIRNTKSLDGKESSYEVWAPVVKEAMDKEWHPETLVTANDIGWKEHIDMQAAAQEYVDTAISKTLNLPRGTTPEQVEEIYKYAWRKGLKGATIFVDGSRDPILTTSNTKHPEEKTTPCFNCITPVSRKAMGVTNGCTFCKKCACGTLYITTNNDQNGNLVEIFTHTSKGGICQANLNAETRMASLALRAGVKVDEVVDQLKGITCPACTTVKARGGSLDGISCPDIIAKTILEFVENKPSETTKLSESINVPTEYEECPECHEKTLIREAGCKQCTSCGYSKCE